MNILKILAVVDSAMDAIKSLTSAIKELTEELRKRKETNG